MGLTISQVTTPNAPFTEFAFGPFRARLVDVTWDSAYLVGGERLTAASLGWSNVYGAMPFTTPVADDGALAYVDFGTAITQLQALIDAQETLAAALAEGAAGDVTAGLAITASNVNFTNALNALTTANALIRDNNWVAAAPYVDTVGDELILASADWTAAATAFVDDAADTALDLAVVDLAAAGANFIAAAVDLAAGAPIAAGADVDTGGDNMILAAVDYDTMADAIVQAGATAAGIAGSVALDASGDAMLLAAAHMVAGTLVRTPIVSATAAQTEIRFELSTTGSVEVTDDTDVSLFTGRFLVVGA